MSLVSEPDFRSRNIVESSNLIKEMLQDADKTVKYVPFIIRGSRNKRIYSEVGILEPIGVVYLRVGGYIFLDRSLKAVHEKYKYKGQVDRVIYLSAFNAFLNHPNNVLYTVTAIAAIEDVDLENKIVLDLGCAEGILGILGLRKGAKRIFGVDRDEKVKESVAADSILNKISPSELTCITTDFNNIDLILKSVPKETDIAFANIGPHYGAGDLEALSLLKFFPNIKTVMAGGYNLGQANLRPIRALMLLAKMGFKKNLKYYIPENTPHTAFIIER